MAELNITNDYKHNAFLSNYQSYDTSGTMFDDTSFSETTVEFSNEDWTYYWDTKVQCQATDNFIQW